MLSFQWKNIVLSTCTYIISSIIAASNNIFQWIPTNIINYTLFFYKNKLYKNTQAEICPKIKVTLRTITRLKFWPENLRNLFKSCTQIKMYMKTKLVRILAWSSPSGAGRVINKLLTFANAVLTVSNPPFYMYFSGQLIHCIKNIRKWEQFKNNLWLKSPKN